MPLLQSKFSCGISFHVMAVNWRHLKDTLVFSSFIVCLNRNRVLLTSGLLPNISLVIGQLSVNISLALCTHEISTSRLTSNQRYIEQHITVSKNLFLKYQGPVVQSIVSLMCLLRGQLVKYFTTLLLNTVKFFVEKMREAFALQKLFTLFQQKILANSRY